MVADFVTFTRSKGLYGGVNLDGTSVQVSDDWNGKYYGKTVTVSDILVKRTVRAKGAQTLLATVSKAAAAKK